LNPELSRSKRNLGQPVRTLNRALAARSLDSPAARTAWCPGVADLGTLNFAANAPPGWVVAEPTSLESNVPLRKWPT
jgi:hypothetical protein